MLGVKKARSQEKVGQEIILSDQMEIINLIELLRSRLENIIALKENLTDPEVLAASQALDEALNELC